MSEPFLALIYLTTPPHDNCPVLKEMYTTYVLNMRGNSANRSWVLVPSSIRISPFVLASNFLRCNGQNYIS